MPNDLPNKMPAKLAAHLPEGTNKKITYEPVSSQDSPRYFFVSRRHFMAGSILASVAASLPLGWRALAKGDLPTTPLLPLAAPRRAGHALNLELKVNGQTHSLSNVDPRTTLLDALRERLDLTGSKKGCDHGQCGACTVLVDGQRVNACLTLAAQAQRKEITTIEGLAKGDQLHPIQEAFISHDAFQCGYCTPGQIMSAVALLKEPCGKSDAAVSECMSGNICRCGAYRNIISAIQEVRGGSHASL